MPDLKITPESKELVKQAVYDQLRIQTYPGKETAVLPLDQFKKLALVLAGEPTITYLSFQTKPSLEELRLAVSVAMKRPFPVTSYRFVARSDGDTSFLVEEIDILADLEASRL